VSPIVARGWAGGFNRFSQAVGPELRPWFDTFAPGGRAPRAGERWSSPAHAATLERIAESGARDFYEGGLARQIAAFAAETGGLMTADDLAAHTSTWVEPISGRYHGYDVWEIPPNGQGIATLIGLQILDGLDLAAHPRESVESYHLQIEAMKLSLIDARRYVADMDVEDVPVQGLLDPAYAAERRALIGDRALDPSPGTPARGGTIYLCAADADGMMVSYIQSNYQGFGSGVVVPDTGIALHNRGYGFVTEPGHLNRLAPRKRPFHTIIPAFLTRDGEPIGPFGVMGGHMQTQGHLQMTVNTLDYAMNPQASLDAPRWRWDAGRTVAIEPGVPEEIAEGLRARGHDVVREETTGGFGKGQIIWRLPEGGYVAGSDPRSDGYAAAY
jgi:gamma-glutamyltranspeptidase/glutathione hydrolase